MQLKSLKVEQFRGFTSATEVSFNEQFTLIAGENGLGKSSILWALRVLLSRIVHAGPKRSADRLTFRVEDVALGWPYLRAEAVVHTVPERIAAKCVAQKNTATFVRSPLKHGRPREHAVDTPDSYDVKYEAVGPPHRSRVDEIPWLAVYYSAHRSLSRDMGVSKSRVGGGARAAHAEALDDRELRLGEQAALWHKEAVLEKSDGLPASANRSIESALPIFLGDFAHLRTEEINDEVKLVVDKQGKRLELDQLSDGERGILTILLDLTRRLGQLNPALENPARDGSAVVLIDELDLHLHPKWQRCAVSNLKKAFPKVQFVATTHSPQIIGQLSGDQVLLLQPDGPPLYAGQSFGMDTNWILRHIMDSDDRDPEVASKLEALLSAIRAAKFTLANRLISDLRSQIGEASELVAAEAMVARAQQIPAESEPGASKLRKKKSASKKRSKP